MKPLHPLERVLAVVGAAACLIITIVLWRNVAAFQGIWPLPGLYFIEMALLGIVCALTLMFGGAHGRLIPWAGAGIFAAFSILGAFSVGFFYLPFALIFSAISLSSDVRNKQPVRMHLALFLLAGIAQGVIMWMVISWLSVGAAF